LKCSACIMGTANQDSSSLHIRNLNPHIHHCLHILHSLQPMSQPLHVCPSLLHWLHPWPHSRIRASAPPKKGCGTTTPPSGNSIIAAAIAPSSNTSDKVLPSGAEQVPQKDHMVEEKKGLLADSAVNNDGPILMHDVEQTVMQDAGWQKSVNLTLTMMNTIDCTGGTSRTFLCTTI
jgi:hypothetical protein